jgi:hypothetical protein
MEMFLRIAPSRVIEKVSRCERVAVIHRHRDDAGSYPRRPENIMKPPVTRHRSIDQKRCCWNAIPVCGHDRSAADQGCYRHYQIIKHNKS